ncbi:MAG: 2-C-methyl-D-erythritol 4-phosphate cytidylyltransferase, partial [Bdellovibrionales bacterium]|nr:2-C-methyl-D-erythritol 4-phosphate cytidylyltransferase [Bdellovibrionales bacterium]
GLDGAICAQPIRDSLKKVREGLISHDVDREDVWAMQTPQVFHYPWILQVYDQAEKEGHCATDDASLAQRYGGKVCVVPSSSFNIKITYPEDLDWAQRILDMRKQEAQ